MAYDLPANTICNPYRSLAYHQVDFRLERESVITALLGKEAYRRTQYIVLRYGNDVTVVSVTKASQHPLFSPIVDVAVLAGPNEAVFIDSPETDVSNATALAKVALGHAERGKLAYVIKGRFEHVNFIWNPAPVVVRVTEVVPPNPPKLISMVEQVIAFDDMLPPIELVHDIVNLTDLASDNPARCHLLPCSGSGAKGSATVLYLDDRPLHRTDWILLGCERSAQIYRHFYDEEPSRVEICPRLRPSHRHATLTKCCLIERGIERESGQVVVPWGATLDEVREALRWLVAAPAPADSESAR